jgi:hypothetical protein
MRQGFTIVATAAVLVAAVLIGACVSSAGTSIGAPATSALPASRTVAPGITEWADGTVEVTGYVQWMELEGGFWALVDRAAHVDGSRQPKVVAVLLPGPVSETTISTFNGSYVVARGRMQGGASIRMAGPEVVVDKLVPALPPAD